MSCRRSATVNRAALNASSSPSSCRERREESRGQVGRSERALEQARLCHRRRERQAEVISERLHAPPDRIHLARLGVDQDPGDLAVHPERSLHEVERENDDGGRRTAVRSGRPGDARRRARRRVFRASASSCRLRVPSQGSAVQPPSATLLVLAPCRRPRPRRARGCCCEAAATSRLTRGWSTRG